MESSQQTSSIGATWPTSASSHERIRGFYTEGTITSQAESDALTNYVYSAIEQMNSTEAISRVSLRAVAELGSLAKLAFDNTASIEAVLPIAGTDLGVVYIGANQLSRNMGVEYVNLHHNLLERSIQRLKVLPRHQLDVQLIDRDNVSGGVMEDFTQLYSAFNYDHQETADLLRNESNIIAYAMINDRVASTAMAERGTLYIEGFGELSLIEITEASTDPRYRRRGVYTQVSGFLIDHLVHIRQDEPGSIDVIYGESNLAMPGVIHAAHLNGRRFSHFDGSLMGIENNAFGFLPQNFKVNDGVETRNYNDFAVSYVPLEGC